MPALGYDFGDTSSAIPFSEVLRGTRIGGCAPSDLGYDVVETSPASPFRRFQETPVSEVVLRRLLVMF